MSGIYADITKTVGNTPLVRLNHITEGLEATVVVKAGILQPPFQREGPDRGGHDRGRREERAS